jgi:hypothetical protein
VNEEHVRLDPQDISMMMMVELDVPLHDRGYSEVLRAAVPIIMAIRA